MRKSRLIAGLAVSSLVLAGCGGGDPTEENVGGAFSVYVCEPEHLVPQNTNETCGAEVLGALFTPLVDYDPQTNDVQIGAGTAASVESPDQRVWTIRLKDGWTFHNGEPVDAAAYARAWNAGAYGPNAYGNAYFFENIEGYDELQVPADAPAGTKPPATQMSGLEVVDPLTLRVTLKQPFSQFPVTLGYTAFYPLPEAYTGDPAAFEERPIGNGPFRMDGSWQHNQQIQVQKYAEYAGEPAQADAITFRIYSNVNTGYNDLLAGNLDIMDALPPERLVGARNQFGERYIERPSSSFTYIGFPLYDDRFDDVRLRKAISMAIDRQAIIDAIFNGAYTPARSLVSPVVAGARENPCGDSCRFDPAAARRMLDEAGGFTGTLTLWFNSGSGHEKWMEAVSNQLRTNLGITSISFRSLEFAEYLSLLDAEDVTGPFRLGWVMDYPSPQNYLQPIYSTTGSSNNFGYSNSRVDALLNQGNAAESVDAGIRLYQQAEDLILADMPNVPMWFGKVQGAHSATVGNVAIDAFSRIRLAQVTVNQ
ncbi:peptide ABC transporter substrate-binding protein [Paractinoplanes rishiriensis]|uniref:Peptide ABC transporter DppA n=1 Tax=Paractinoplanes rishiriensis TaxID=1050105 RepID=A0A919K9N2_9ACTN|nr:ABC transporter substrate-binding protein [Actinoplanes rishiriensis]GIF01225.1 putative peptide ABC transporter DppA [Actinoplanes rishiriensis]